MGGTTRSERNRIWLARFAKVIAGLGIFLLIGGVPYGGVYCYYLGFGDPGFRWYTTSSLFNAAGISLTGFLALGLSNLLLCVVDAARHPNWFLKHADKGLCLLALSRLFSQASIAGFMFKTIPNRSSWYANLGMTGTLSLANILILLAIALVIRRGIPIIEESRTLV